MDKSQAIGLVVLAAFLMAYFYFFTPETAEKPVDQPAQQEQVQSPDTSVLTEKESVREEIIENDSARQQQLSGTFGAFIAGAEGNEEFFVLENNLMKVELSNKGGIVKRVTLKEFENYKFEPLVLFDEANSNIHLKINTKNGALDLADLYFQQDNSFPQKTDTSGVAFTLNLSGGERISHVYYLPDDSYQLIQYNDYEALSNHATEDRISFNWNNNFGWATLRTELYIYENGSNSEKKQYEKPHLFAETQSRIGPS